MARTSIPTVSGALDFQGTLIDQETARPGGDVGTERQGFSQALHFSSEDSFEQDTTFGSDLSDFELRLVSPPCPTAEFIASDAVTSSNANTSDILLRAKGSSGQHRNVDDEETAASVCATLPEVDMSPVSTIPMADFGTCNVGSIGHPVLCSRPCIHSATGRCANGMDCQFCHVLHTNLKKGAHLPKKHRFSLQRMTTEEAAAILWPILHGRVLAFDRSAAVLEALATLDGALRAGVGTELQLAADAGQHSLARVLSGFNLRRVLLTLESVTTHLPLVIAASESLLMRLRDVALARA